MATEIPSQQDLYELFKNELQTRAPQITDFEEGSIADSLAGATSVGGQELLKVMVQFFGKTFFNTANGPEVTGSSDDLEFLAVDHFGQSFARPEATPAVGTVEFTRPTTGAGNVLIPAGTIVKTNKDADGNEQRFTVDSDVTMIGLSVNANVTAEVAGTEGNVGVNTVINIESALTDGTIVVNNSVAFSGGAAEQTDTEYREFIRNNVELIRGATKAAIQAAALNVSGVDSATAVENLQSVIQWDIGTGTPVGASFFIPRVQLYIADSFGSASQALIDAVDEAVFVVRACGVKIDIFGATPLPMNWSATLTLDPGGPNFPEFSTDTTRIVESMTKYILDLPIGTGFSRGLARLAMLSIWGPSGTGDLTDFTTNLPTGDIAAATTDKLIPGTVTA